MRALEYLIDLNRSLFCLKALLDHIRRELKLTVSYEIAGYEVQNFIVSGLVVQLQDILDQIVAERIFYEQEKPLDNFVGKSKLLSSETLFQAALHNAASVLVSTNSVTVGNASVENKLGVCCEFVRTFCVHLIWCL